jgi:hypothetical protein
VTARVVVDIADDDGPLGSNRSTLRRVAKSTRRALWRFSALTLPLPVLISGAIAGAWQYGVRKQDPTCPSISLWNDEIDQTKVLVNASDPAPGVSACKNVLDQLGPPGEPEIAVAFADDAGLDYQPAKCEGTAIRRMAGAAGATTHRTDKAVVVARDEAGRLHYGGMRIRVEVDGKGKLVSIDTDDIDVSEIKGLAEGLAEAHGMVEEHDPPAPVGKCNPYLGQ